jgi:hypothetical protein
MPDKYTPLLRATKDRVYKALISLPGSSVSKKRWTYVHVVVLEGAPDIKPMEINHGSSNSDLRSKQQQ